MQRLKKIIAYILLGLSSIGLITTGITFAWFTQAGTKLGLDNAAGDIFVKYFHSGTGEENDPYTITEPVHFNNLTELYSRHPDFYEQNYHFKLLNNIDMTTYPSYRPIGSEEKPFGGNFDGQNYTVENLSVSGNGISDIGVFGYVTEDANIENLYFDNLTIDVTGAVNNKHNHEAHNSNAYVGYLAGHIDDARCFENTYVNNCEIIGHSVLTKNDWGYFGRCDNAATLDEFINKANGQGSGEEWGGSINMKGLNLRLRNMLNDSSVHYYGRSNKWVNYTDDYNYLTAGYNLNNMKTYYEKDPESQRVFYRMMGKGHYYYSPFSDDLPGSCVPLITSSVDDFEPTNKNTGYIVGGSKTKNSSGYYTTSSSPTVTSASYQLEFICHSVADGTYDDATIVSTSESTGVTSYNSSNFEILTNNNASYDLDNFVAIKDSFNATHTIASTSPLYGRTKNDNTSPEKLKLEKYNNSRDALHHILSGASFIHGIHFNEPDDPISISDYITMPNAKINGVDYEDYQLPQSCIDFNLKKNGKINFFAGSYYAKNSTDASADSFFSLHKIERNASTKSLTDIKQIAFIYSNKAYVPGSTTISKYIYKYYGTNYNNGVYSDTGTTTPSSNLGDLLFDMRYITETPPIRNAVYYFEIPVNSGEYAMGVVDGKSGGGYLMYLDIGASGADNDEELVDDFKSVEYRTTPNTADRSILLITYIQYADQEVNLKVVYIEQNKRYSITVSGSAGTEIIITQLSTEYIIYCNGVALPQIIGSHDPIIT